MPGLKSVIAAVALGLGAATATAGLAADDSALSAGDSLEVYHLFAGPDAVSHVEKVRLKLIEGKYGLKSLIDANAQRVKLGVSPDGLMMGFHHADHRTLLMPLQGSLVVDVGDGTLYRLPPGAVVLAEDRTGRGHRSGCEAKAGSRQCWTLQVTLLDDDQGLQVMPK